jgi:AcrR family transcriptional regulator
MARDNSPGGSIWLRPERSARGPAPEHSRAEITAAAVALADAAGVGAVTMRSVAAAIGTGPASLYRYVATRSELLELMADQARGELTYAGTSSAEPAVRLLALAREGRALYLRHPWLLDIPAAPIPGPNAIAFIEHALAALMDVDLSGPAKLETIGLFSGAVRLLAQTEIEQRQAGQNAAQWQSELAAYLAQIAAAGQHPHLAAILTGPPSTAPARQPDDLFERAMARILDGLLPPRLCQQLDPHGRVAGGQLAIEGYQRSATGLGKGRKVVIGPQLVTLVITRGDGSPDCVQFGWLSCPQNALVGPELIVGSPCLTAVDGILAHDGGVGQQPQQSHLRDPAEGDVVRLFAEPVRRNRLVDVPPPDSGQPHTHVNKLHWEANRSMSSASSASAMSSLVTSTAGVASRAISGSVTRPVFPLAVAGKPTSRATARPTRSLRLSPSSAARAFAARIRVGGKSIVVRIKAYYHQS